MKNHKLFSLIILILIPFCLTGCISIGISSSPEPAKNLSYESPKAPFSAHKIKTGDKIWLSEKTGNSISFISDCSLNSDPSLEALEIDALSGIENIEVQETNTLEYNQRKAKKTVAKGSVDGIKIKVKVISFKKNSCNYNLLFAGKQERFESELSDFDKFAESFKAP